MNKQQTRKNAIGDAITDALGKLALGAILAVVLMGLPIFGLWKLTGSVEYATLRWVTVGLVFGLLLAFGAGYVFGRYEVKGFLGGMDTALDKLADAVDMRDRSRIAVHQATRQQAKPQPNFNVYLPQPAVPITSRQLSDDEVIDL
jgi:hypothetical protein